MGCWRIRAATRRRVNLAEEMVWEYRRELGQHMVAAACSASVAHGRADAHSDLELLVLTDIVVEAVNVHTERNEIQVECDALPTERVRHAAQVVTIECGVEVECLALVFIANDSITSRSTANRRAPTISRNICYQISNLMRLFLISSDRGELREKGTSQQTQKGPR